MRRVLSVFCAIAMLICLGLFVHQNHFVETYQERAEYKALREQYSVPTLTPIRDDEEDPYVSVKHDFDGLIQTNEDTAAWVFIPGTNIDYPVVWREGDLDYYLHRSFKKKHNVTGAIFLDGDCKKDLSSRQNLFYGHHMVNHSMFYDLIKFKDQKYFDANRHVYVYTPKKTYKLETIACLYTDAGSERRKTEFTSQEELTKYIDEMTKGCRFRKLPDEKIGRLWAFVTCSYEGRNTRTILYAWEPGEQDPFPVPEAKPATAANAVKRASGALPRN